MNAGNFRTDDKWKEVKIDVMRAILLEKYTQCTDYREYLERTGTQRIIEDTNHYFWGNGKNGDGYGILGQLHEWIRDTCDKKKLQPYTQQLPGNSRTYWTKTNTEGKH